MCKVDPDPFGFPLDPKVDLLVLVWVSCPSVDRCCEKRICWSGRLVGDGEGRENKRTRTRTARLRTARMKTARALNLFYLYSFY